MGALLRRAAARNRAIARLRDESGVALIMAIVVVATLTISTAALTSLAATNEKSFGRDRQEVRALNDAEAGLNAAVSTLKASGPSTTSIPNLTGSIDGGSWSYTTSRTQPDPTGHPNDYLWTITATGTSPTGAVNRQVQTQVKQSIIPGTGTVVPPAPSYSYGMFMGDPNSDCIVSGGNVFSGGAAMSVPIFVAGSLCITGNLSIAEPASSPGGTLSLYVGKKFKTDGALIGTSAKHIGSATVVGGCVAQTTPVSCSQQGDPKKCGGQQGGCGSGIFANIYSSTQSTQTKVPIDAATYYSNSSTISAGASAGGCNNNPLNPAQVSTYPSGWTATTFRQNLLDNNTTRNTSLGSVTLLSNSFDCRLYAADGTLLSRLAWTGGCSGTLIIQGSVFIDGNFSFGSNCNVVYQGRGTLYVNGTVTFSGGATVCAQPISGSPCAGNWDPNQNVLEIVANNASSVTPGFSLAGGSVFEGVAYTNGQFSGAGGSSFNGNVTADTAIFAGNAGMKTVNPPPSAPGASYTTPPGPSTVTWTPVAGSWQQLK
jgi:hypothetical protein